MEMGTSMAPHWKEAPTVTELCLSSSHRRPQAVHGGKEFSTISERHRKTVSALAVTCSFGAAIFMGLRMQEVRATTALFSSWLVNRAHGPKQSSTTSDQTMRLDL